MIEDVFRECVHKICCYGNYNPAHCGVKCNHGIRLPVVRVDHHGNGVMLHPRTGILQSWERNTAGWNKRIKRLKVLPSLILENRLLKMSKEVKVSTCLSTEMG